MITSSGAWRGRSKQYHDDKLSISIIHILKNKKALSCFDFGCGDGFYSKTIIDNNIPCIGYDGNISLLEHADNNCVLKIMDLTTPHNDISDWILCLEVGEHIPKEYEKTFIYNLKNCCVSGLIISWAIPNQGGIGHVNEQSNEYVKKILTPEFEIDIESTNYLRSNSTLRWFKNTIMVFDKTKDT